jgi:hypothetical protein
MLEEVLVAEVAPADAESAPESSLVGDGQPDGSSAEVMVVEAIEPGSLETPTAADADGERAAAVDAQEAGVLAAAEPAVTAPAAEETLAPTDSTPEGPAPPAPDPADRGTPPQPLHGSGLSPDEASPPRPA